jgi:membrane-associated phospholipid phosphatase
MTLTPLYNVLSASVIAFYVIPLILYAWTSDPFHLKALAGYIVTTLASEGIKHGVIKGRGPYGQRPAGATDCNLWCNNGPQAGRPGMPSSHSAEAAYLAMVYGSSSHRLEWVLYALLVMGSRYAKECHSLPQIVVGAVVGVLIGLLTMRFV